MLIHCMFHPKSSVLTFLNSMEQDLNGSFKAVQSHSVTLNFWGIEFLFFKLYIGQMPDTVRDLLYWIGCI